MVGRDQRATQRRDTVARAALIGAAILGVSLPVFPLLGLIAGTRNARSWAAAVADARALELLLTTVALALVVSAAAMAAGTWLAWVERRGAYRWAQALAVLALVPLAVPSYVLAGTLRQALGPGGAIGQALGWGPFTGFWPAALALFLSTVPFVQLLVGAALTRVPAQEEEAARTLGASASRVFGAVVLPRLRPSLAFSTLLVQLYVISDFGAVAMLDCPVLTWRMYRAVDNNRLEHALVLGICVLLVTLPLLMAARLIQGRPSMGAVANPKPPQRRRVTGAALVATYALHLTVIGLGVALPIWTLLDWSTGAASLTGLLAELGKPVADSLKVALIGGAITVALAASPAWVAVRGTARGAGADRWSFWLEQATYLTSALPGVLLAFGLLLGALAIARGTGDASATYYALTSSGVLLVVGYATRFLSQAFAPLKSAVMALDPRQEDSARVLGAGRLKRAVYVIAPALVPGVAASFLLVTIAIVKELPVTLLLGGAMGLRTLSFRMFDRYADAFLPDAGVAGLVLVSLALVAFAVSMRWRHHA